MSVRVVARIRPLLNSEIDRDQIVSRHDGADGKRPIVKLPNPKNSAEEYSFQFNSVYGQEAAQQEIFEAEGWHLHPTRIAPNTHAHSLPNHQAAFPRLRRHHLCIRYHG